MHIVLFSVAYYVAYYGVALVSRIFAKEPYKRDNIPQKRPIILSILLTVATPYLHHFSFFHPCTCTAAVAAAENFVFLILIIFWVSNSYNIHQFLMFYILWPTTSSTPPSSTPTAAAHALQPQATTATSYPPPTTPQGTNSRKSAL